MDRFMLSYLFFRLGNIVLKYRAVSAVLILLSSHFIAKDALIVLSGEVSREFTLMYTVLGPLGMALLWWLGLKQKVPTLRPWLIGEIFLILVIAGAFAAGPGIARLYSLLGIELPTPLLRSNR